jgi:hypothetical protein
VARFSGDVIIAIGAFAPSHVLSYGNLAYVNDYSGKLHHLEVTALVDNESLVSCPSPSLQVADLEVLAR